MARSRAPLLSRLLFLLAWCQVVGPAVSAVADAWRQDKREAYVHIESESTPGCVIVHDHDCLLCSVATGATGRPPEPMRVPLAGGPSTAPTTVLGAPRDSFCRGRPSPRAPPVMSV
ncbi:MAG: hypothetical protein P3C10_06830 [Gemmatimonadota bacterium]|nr:hypothetical protein [Gemmatimonadota bacterium]